MKILGSIWFSSLTNPGIGIILIHNGNEERAYIGTSDGLNKNLDCIKIARIGAKFPLKQAKELIGV